MSLLSKTRLVVTTAVAVAKATKQYNEKTVDIIKGGRDETKLLRLGIHLNPVGYAYFVKARMDESP